MPRVSIVVPTYNRLPLLQATLPTLLAQTEPDLEILIVDGASTDGTQGYVDRIRDPRLRLLASEHRLPHMANWTRAIQAARGRYVALYHDDDIYAPSIAARSAEFLDGHPMVGMVHVAARAFGESNRNLGLRRAARRDFVRNGAAEAERWATHIHDVIPSSTMVRREVYEEVGGFEPDLYFADFDVYVRIALVSDIGFIADPLLWLRNHGKSVTNNMRPMRFVEEIDALLPRFLRHFAAAGVEPRRGWGHVERCLRRSLARRVRALAFSLVSRGDRKLALDARRAALALDGSMSSRLQGAALAALDRRAVGWALGLLRALRSRFARSCELPAT